MIRPAVPDDAEVLLDMGQAFHAEAGYADRFDFVPGDFAVALDAMSDAGLLLVAEKDGQVVGMAGADAAPLIFNRSVRIGREAFWYIQPAHRKGIGRELLSALECAAKSYGAAIFDVVAEDGEGKRGVALARLYRAASYSPAESVFRKVL